MKVCVIYCRNGGELFLFCIFFLFLFLYVVFYLIKKKHSNIYFILLQNKLYSLSSQENNTYKQYYFPTSDCPEEETQELYIQQEMPSKKRKSESLDNFFDSPTKNKRKLNCSTVSRINKENGRSYISTNTDDGATASYLIKIELYDLKKISKIPPSQHWKHANVRVKYYTQKTSTVLANTNDIIYNITKEIAQNDDCKKYSFNS